MLLLFKLFYLKVVFYGDALVLELGQLVDVPYIVVALRYSWCLVRLPWPPRQCNQLSAPDSSSKQHLAPPAPTGNELLFLSPGGPRHN